MSGVSHLAAAVPLGERKIDGYPWRAEKQRPHSQYIPTPTTTRMYLEPLPLVYVHSRHRSCISVRALYPKEPADGCAARYITAHMGYLPTTVRTIGGLRYQARGRMWHIARFSDLEGGRMLERWYTSSRCSFRMRGLYLRSAILISARRNKCGLTIEFSSNIQTLSDFAIGYPYTNVSRFMENVLGGSRGRSIWSTHTYNHRPLRWQVSRKGGHNWKAAKDAATILVGTAIGAHCKIKPLSVSIVEHGSTPRPKASGLEDLDPMFILHAVKWL